MYDKSQYRIDYDDFDWSYANQAFPVRDVLGGYFGLHVNAIGRCQCPVHQGEKYNMQIKDQQNYAVCYSECNDAFRPIELLKRAENKTATDAFFELCDYFSLDPLEFPGVVQRKAPEREQPKQKSVFTFLTKEDYRRLDLSHDLTRMIMLPGQKQRQLSDSEIAFILRMAILRKKNLLSDIAETIDTYHSGTAVKEYIKPIVAQYDNLLSFCNEQLTSPEIPNDIQTILKTVFYDVRYLDKEKISVHEYRVRRQYQYPQHMFPKMKSYTVNEYKTLQYPIIASTKFEAEHLERLGLKRLTNDYVLSPDGTHVAAVPPVNWLKYVTHVTSERVAILQGLLESFEEEFLPLCSTQELMDRYRDVKKLLSIDLDLTNNLRYHALQKIPTREVSSPIVQQESEEELERD